MDIRRALFTLTYIFFFTINNSITFSMYKEQSLSLTNNYYTQVKSIATKNDGDVNANYNKISEPPVLITILGVGIFYYVCDYPFWIGLSYLYAGGVGNELKDEMLTASGALYNFFLTKDKNRDEVFLTNITLWSIWLIWPSDKKTTTSQSQSMMPHLYFHPDQTIVAWNFIF